MTCILTVLLVSFLGSSGQLLPAQRATETSLMSRSDAVSGALQSQMCLSGVGRNNRVKTQAGLLNVVHFVGQNNCK